MKIIKDFFNQAGGGLISTVVLGIYRVLLARFIGPELLGIFSSTLNFTTVSSRWLSLGISPSIQYYANKNIDKNKLFSYSLFFSVGLSLIFLSATQLFIRYFSKQFEYPESFNHIINIYSYCGIFIYLSLIFPIFILGNKQYYFYQQTQVIPILALICSFFVFVNFNDVLFAAVYSQIVYWITASFISCYRFRGYKLSFTISDVLFRKVIKYGIHAWPIVFLQFGISRITIFIAMMFISASEIGYFTLAANVSEILSSILKSINPIIFNKASDDSLGITKLLFAMKMSFYVNLCIGSIFILFGKYFFIKMFSNSFASSWDIMPYVLISVLLNETIHLCSNYFAGRNKLKYTIFIQSNNLIFLVISLVILTPVFKLDGVVIAFFLASFYSFCITVWLIKKHDCDISIYTILVLSQDDFMQLNKIRSYIRKLLIAKVNEWKK